MSNIISVAQYAAIRKISPQAVYQAIKRQDKMPGVTKVIKAGERTVVLSVDDNIVNPLTPSVEEDWL